MKPFSTSFELTCASIEVAGAVVSVLALVPGTMSSVKPERNIDWRATFRICIVCWCELSGSNNGAR